MTEFAQGDRLLEYICIHFQLSSHSAEISWHKLKAKNPNELVDLVIIYQKMSYWLKRLLPVIFYQVIGIKYIMEFSFQLVWLFCCEGKLIIIAFFHAWLMESFWETVAAYWYSTVSGVLNTNRISVLSLFGDWLQYFAFFFKIELYWAWFWAGLSMKLL